MSWQEIIAQQLLVYAYVPKPHKHVVVIVYLSPRTGASRSRAALIDHVPKHVATSGVHCWVSNTEILGFDSTSVPISVCKGIFSWLTQIGDLNGPFLFVWVGSWTSCLMLFDLSG
jgi:hypothetical protein